MGGSSTQGNGPLYLKKQMVMPPSLEPRSHRAPDNANEQQKARDSILQINVTLQAVLVGYPRVPAGRLVVERSRRRSRGPARHQAPCRHSRVAAAPKSACALDGFGCPTEAPYGCFLPDLTRFGTCRHPNPSNALGARYILPAPARQSKVANLGRSSFDYFCSPIARAANE